MTKLLNWLEKEVEGCWSVLLYIFAFVVLALIYCTSIMELFFYLHIKTPIASCLKANLAFYITTAIFEEFMFRLPLAVAVIKWGVSKKVLHCAIFISVLFGWAHMWGILSIPIQGVTGFLLSMLFLKCGGFQQKPVKALATTIVAHIIYNKTAETIYCLCH